MEQRAEKLLEVKDLQVDFRVGDGKTVTAVQDVSFSLVKGHTLGIVGESGCGKSVTANTIMKLLPKESGIIAGGQILFGGKDIVPMSEDEMRDIRGKHIGMIFQEPMTSLNPVYRIETQMTEMLLAHEKLSKKEAHERCLSMLRQVGIPEPERRLREYPHQLSGGMRQRVMIAMVLSVSPELIIADEPTTALDVTIQAQIMELMGELKEQLGTSIILITHDMGVIADIADDVMVMYGGNVVEQAPVEAVFDHPLHPYTQGLLASIPRMDQDVEELAAIEGTVPSLDEMPTGCHFSTRCPYCTDKCRQQRPPLIDLDGQKVACWKYE
jgi:peptide/nickel transport system ATP-binding protein/oligopeptide transport system ATP-binding protein